MFRWFLMVLSVLVLQAAAAQAQIPGHRGAGPALPPLAEAPPGQLLLHIDKRQVIWWEAEQDQFHYDMTLMLDDAGTDEFIDIVNYNLGSMMALGISGRYIGSFMISDEMLDGTVRVRVPVKVYQQLVVGLPRRGEKPIIRTHRH